MDQVSTQAQLLALIILSMLVGWALGRYQYRTRSSGKAIKPLGAGSGDGSSLRLLVDMYSDSAVDEFLSGLEVNAKTLPIHLSIGRHFRREGEVDRAILIHQNILAYPQLPTSSVRAVTFELAKDYKSAGLYDRAESLLKELVFSRDLSDPARRLLLSILERQKDWSEAIDLISKWDCRRDSELATRMAHYHCELAHADIDCGRFERAQRHLKYARKVDRDSARATLMLAELMASEQRYEQAISLLRGLFESDSDVAPLALSLLVECSNRTQTRPQMMRFLEQQYLRYRSLSILLALVEQLLSVEAADKNKDKARALLEDYLDSAAERDVDLRAVRLYLRHFVPKGTLTSELVRMYRVIADNANGDDSDNMLRYKCASCGFDHGFHWQCPNCFAWDSIKPVETVNQ